ncbi:D-tyrosyl-tRNA(Tyr) deacylase [Candidatus Marinamargulisbacteria bacterium SCGC AG-343-D04]|nr:D-tyrosyl-tRNA(Tyr) deacylase [Candidatus Marinamargulisbacteria bacterium SCGC AG-343-D04]
MRAVIQRVSSASVTVDGECVSSIERGLLVLLGVGKGDSEKEAQWLVDKILNCRIFSDNEGKMNDSVMDVGGGCLVVSQFTLFGDCRKGRRPSFVSAAEVEDGRRLYDYAVKLFKEKHSNIQTGQFRASMDVALVNDGPVTLVLDSESVDNKK